MAARQFVFPKVTEIRVARTGPGGQSIATPTQRDLVAASLVLCPYGKEQRVSRGRRTV